MAKSRVYFISDVHGSNRCFRKFLNAAGFYKADILILGGDITGKVLTPIIGEGDGSFRCTYQGSDLVLKNNEEVEEFRKKAADFGQYTSMMSPRVQRAAGQSRQGYRALQPTYGGKDEGVDFPGGGEAREDVCEMFHLTRKR